MKQTQLKIPSQSTKFVYLSQNKLTAVKYKNLPRYKQSFTQIKNKLQSTSERFSCFSKKGEQLIQKEKKKRSVTQIQNKSIKNQSILKRKLTSKNQRSIFMNKIKNQILSYNKIGLSQYEHQTFQIQNHVRLNERNKNQKKSIYLNQDKFAKTQQFQKHITSSLQFNQKTYYSTFGKIDNQRKQQSHLQKFKAQNQNFQERSKEKGLILDQIKQKKILKYINEFETQTSKQLQYLQKIANDKFHKKSGKIGMALQRVSQMRLIKNEIICNLRKNLLVVKPLSQSQTLIPQSINQNFPKQFDNKQEQLQPFFQNVTNLSMIQEPPKQTVQQIDNQLQHTFKDYLKDYENLLQHKKEVYKKFRNQLVYEFPYMLNKYKQYQIEIPDKIFHSQDENIKIKIEKINKLKQTQLNSSFESTNIKLSNSNQKQEALDIKRLLQTIFKRAYFYSKSKKKVIETKTPTIEQQKEKQDKLQKKTKYSYLNYLKDKSKNNNLKKLKMSKGQMLIKSKEIILDIESQGSKQYTNLKKCIDDAIEDCLKQYDIKKEKKIISKKFNNQKINQRNTNSNKIPFKKQVQVVTSNKIGELNKT